MPVTHHIYDLEGKILHTYIPPKSANEEDYDSLAMQDASDRAISLSGADLSNKKISNVNLSGIEIDNAKLDGTTFRKCIIRAGNFQNSQMENVKFVGVDASNSNFSNANMDYSIIISSQLNDSNITKTRLNGTQIKRSSLQGVFNKGAGATFEGSTIIKTTFEGANLISPYFNKATIYHSSFSRMKMQHAHLKDACFNNVSTIDSEILYSSGDNVEFVHTSLATFANASNDLRIQSVNYSRFRNLDINRVVMLYDYGGLDVEENHAQDAEFSAQMHHAIVSRNIPMMAFIRHQYELVFGEGRPINLIDQDYSGRDLSHLDLSHLDMTGSNFTNSKLAHTQMNNSILNGVIIGSSTDKPLDAIGLNLAATKIKGSYLDNVDIDHVEATGLNLTYSVLSRAKSISGIFNHAIISTSRLNLNLNQCELQRANLHNNSISNSKLNSNLQHIIMSGNKLDNVDCVDANLTSATLKSNKINEVSFANAQAPKSIWRDNHITLGCFKNINLSFSRMEMEDYKSCDFNAANLDQGTINSNRYKACDLTDSILTTHTLNPSSFENMSGIDEIRFFSKDMGKALEIKKEPTKTPEMAPQGHIAKLKELMNQFKPII